ncbi:MAG: DUF4296 domain-containing protein [Candidatus Azobacteroides sp.]|nr:DUF4296 domain-containing protein [Candidatus Azobacteroides sp.]
MEDVLFDIHIADAEISDNYTDFRSDEKKQELYASVFKKHHITREQFDASLVWYGKNLSKYLEIYDRLGKRYATLSDSIVARIDRQKIQSAKTDSNQVYIWEGPKAFMLTSLPGKNMFSFDLDTIKLSSKEHYEFTFDVLGITNSSATPLVTLGIGFPDSVFVGRRKITDNGLFTISISPADSITGNPTHLFGSIYLPPQKEDTKIVIHNIKLYKAVSPGK